MLINSIAGRLWTCDTIIVAIRGEARAGHDLSYGARKNVCLACCVPLNALWQLGRGRHCCRI